MTVTPPAEIAPGINVTSTGPLPPHLIIDPRAAAPVVPAIQAEVRSILKPGVKTSEFWVTVAVFVGSTVLLALGQISQDNWKWANGPVAAYILSRGYAKG